MLTDEKPIGYLHHNKADVVHYFHGGSELTYYLIDPEGNLRVEVLGPTKPQSIVPGDHWKATKLEKGEYGLLVVIFKPIYFRLATVPCI